MLLCLDDKTLTLDIISFVFFLRYLSAKMNDYVSCLELIMLLIAFNNEHFFFFVNGDFKCLLGTRALENPHIFPAGDFQFRRIVFVEI